MAAESAILGGVVGLPLVGAVAVLALPARAGRDWPRGIATIFTFGTLFLAVMAARRLDWTRGLPQLPLGRGPFFAADGLSLPLVILVIAMASFACWASFNVRVKSYFSLVLGVLSAILAALLSTGLFTSGMCLLAALAGLYPLVHYFGRDRREAAARRLLVFLLIAVGLFCMAVELDRSRSGTRWMLLASLGLMAGIVPLHRWVQDVLAEASAPVAVLITGVFQTAAGHLMLRTSAGGFGGGTLVAMIGAGSAVYATLAILAGTSDLRRIIAYISTAQMGLFLVGLSTGTQTGGAGAFLLLCGHAISVALLLFIAGMICDRTGHCDLRKLGGIADHMPSFGAWGAVAFLSAMGLPGLAVFPGLYVSIMGVFEAARQHPGNGVMLATACLSISAMMLLAGAAVWTFQQTFLGPGRPEHATIAPLSLSERMILGGLAIFSLAVGILPVILMGAVKAGIELWAAR